MQFFGFFTGFLFLLVHTTSFPVHQEYRAPDGNDGRFAVAKAVFPGTRVFSNLGTTARGSLRKGVTLDFCRISEDCAGDRRCVLTDNAETFEPVFDCPKNSETCFCFPEKLQFCTQHADCDDVREICGLFNPLGDPFCMSSTISFDVPTMPPKPSDPERPENVASGKTMYPCGSDDDCKGDRTCDAVIGEQFIKQRRKCPPKGRTDCVCLPPDPKSCWKNCQCEEGEVCVRLDFLKDKVALCVSADIERHFFFESVASDGPCPADAPIATPSPSVTLEPSTAADPGATPSSDPNQSAVPESASPESSLSPSASPEQSGPSEPVSPAGESATPSITEPAPSPTSDPIDPICIDARALSHLNQRELVFEKHKSTTVLCDASGSCATEGHMVVHNGRAMMMRTYCSVSECVERRMEVNSPKYRRGMRIASKTPGLHFTAFAARYATRAEEAVIRTAIHVGL